MPTHDHIITCIHRGPVVETRQSSTCGCSEQIAIYECHLYHGHCTVKRCNRGQAERICFRGEDRTTPSQAKPKDREACLKKPPIEVGAKRIRYAV